MKKSRSLDLLVHCVERKGSSFDLLAIKVLLPLFLFPLFMYGQAGLSHQTNAQFLKGNHNNTTVLNNKVVLPYKATGMGTFWTQTGQLPQKVQNHQAVSWNNTVYVTGGLDVTHIIQGLETRRITKKVYKATINNGLSNFTDLVDLPRGVMHHASLVANGYLYVIGGIDEDSLVSNKIYHAKIRADGSLSNWIQNTTNLPVPLWGHSANLINGYLIIAGGSQVLSNTAIANIYSVKVEPNGELSTFNVQAALGSKRNQPASAVFNNKLYLMGGYDENNIISNTVVFTEVDFMGNCNVWQSGTNLPEPLSGLTATCDQGILIISGGYNDSLGFSVQYSYYADVSSSSGLIWNQSGLYYTHFANAESFIHQGKLYVLGGLDIFNSTIERCYYNTLVVSGTTKNTSGVFTGDVFDLGMNRYVDTLRYSGQNLNNYNFHYRTALNNGIWSSWTSAGSLTKIPLVSSLRYVQYRFSVDGAATNNNIQLESVSISFSAVQLSGVYTNETWTLANSPYWVTADVYIDGNVVIDAGVSITFGEGVKMEVRQGTLTCNGNSQQPVTLTSFTGDDGYWNGLHFTSGSKNKNSTLNFVIIENAGFLGHANMNCISTNQPTVNNGIIRRGTQGALFCNDAFPVFNNPTLDHNLSYLIRLQNGSGPVFINETLIGNETRTAYVLGGTLSNDAYWDNICNEYLLQTSLSTYSKTLTIEKGIKVMTASGVQIYVNSSGGSIQAVGSNHPDSLIIFTSQSGIAGGWNGINIGSSNASGSTFKFCNFSDGNTYNLNAQGINTTIENCSFSNAAVSGMLLSGTYIYIKNSLFFGNAQRGLYSTGNNNYLVIDSCEFYNNGTHGMECSGTFNLTNSHLYNNGQSGLHLTSSGTSSGTNYEPHVENTLIENNGTNGIWAEDCFPNFINVNVLNNVSHGFLMNANVWPEYFNLNLVGNATNDFRVLGGSISRSISWLIGQYPFIVIGTFSFQGGELYIEKGMTLKFDQNAGMNVGGGLSYQIGKLTAVGTHHPDSIITFTALNGLSGGWTGITIGNYSAGSVLSHCIIEKAINNLTINYSASNVVIDSCDIRYASQRGVNGANSTFLLSHCDIHENAGNGFECGGGYTLSNSNIFQNGGHGFQGEGNCHLINGHIYNNGGTGVRLLPESSNLESHVENTVIENNGTYGIWATDCSPDFINVDVLNNPDHGFLMNANVCPSYYNLNLTGNSTNDIRVNAGSLNRNITWHRGQYPFVVIGSFYTTNNSELSIERGMTISFASNTGIRFGGNSSSYTGRLKAIGYNHPDSLIRFTSLSGEPGGWNGLTFNNYADGSEMVHCIVENAVNNISLSSSIDDLNIDSCVIRNASNWGISSSSSSFCLRHSQIVNNLGYGIYISGTTVPTLGDTLGMGNDIFNNNQYEIYNQSTLNVNARYNFFKFTDSVAISQRIYDKADNASYGVVVVNPFSPTSNNLRGHYISSHLRYRNNDSTLMNNVKVMLLNPNHGMVDRCFTNNEGCATFVGLPDGQYILDGTTNRPWAGANATDALMVMRHFATLITLDGIKLKAADVNASSTVNSTDALSILQRFTHLTDSFAAGNWAFLAEADPVIISGNDVNTPLWSLCYGDINGSHIPGSAKTGIQSVSLTCSGILDADDILIDLPVYLTNPSAVGAISLHIAYPEQDITILDASVNNANTPAVTYAENGVFHVAWCSLTPVNPFIDEPLLTIRLKINNLALLKQGLTLSLVGSNEISDQQAFPIPNATLTYPQLANTTSINPLDYKGAFTFSVSPNPANNHTTMTLVAPENGLLSLRIVTATGAMTDLLDEIPCPVGTNQIPIDISSWKSGLYFIIVDFEGEQKHYTGMLKVSVL